MQIEPIPPWVTLGAATVAIIVANLRGSYGVRVVAAVVTVYVAIDFAHLYAPLSGLPMLVAGFVTCVGCALRSNHYWAVWAAAAAMLSLATKVLRMWLGLGDWAYYPAMAVWFYVLLAALMVGALTSPAPADPRARDERKGDASEDS